MHPQPRRVPLSDQSHAPARATILVVDDELPILHLLRDMLEDEGYAVLVAKEGQEGFNLAFEHHPHLILTDLMMPVMDGHMLCRHLRAEPHTVPIPLIAMSAAYRARDGDAFEAVIAKPFSIVPLLELIQAHLDGAL